MKFFIPDEDAITRVCIEATYSALNITDDQDHADSRGPIIHVAVCQTVNAILAVIRYHAAVADFNDA